MQPSGHDKMAQDLHCWIICSMECSQSTYAARADKLVIAGELFLGFYHNRWCQRRGGVDDKCSGHFVGPHFCIRFWPLILVLPGTGGCPGLACLMARLSDPRPYLVLFELAYLGFIVCDYNDLPPLRGLCPNSNLKLRSKFEGMCDHVTWTALWWFRCSFPVPTEGHH